MKKILALLSSLVLLTNSPVDANIEREYVPYSEIPVNYRLEDSKSDGLVVFENSDITSGQSAWEDFVANAENGKPCIVRLAFYHTLGDASKYSPELYEEIKNDYPLLFIQDLSFDGNVYTLYFVEGEEEYNFTYKYLKKFEEKPQSSSALFSERIFYALINDEEITAEKIIYGMYSSQSGDWIDHKIVYSDYIFIE